jgi:hypothetical protein
MTVLDEFSGREAARLTPASARPIWRYVWKLLWLRWRIFVGGLRRTAWQDKILMGLIGIMGVAFCTVAFIFTNRFIRFLQNPAFNDLNQIGLTISLLPVLILSGVFLSTLFTSLGVLLQALYLSKDMDFLLSTPVPRRAVFMAKLLQAILPNMILIGMFGLPVLFGLGSAGGYHALFYPMGIGLMIACSLAAAGLASLVVMGVVRYFPARVVTEFLALGGAVASLSLMHFGIFSQTLGGERLASIQSLDRLAVLARLDSSWSPLAWAGRALAQAGLGEWQAGLAYFGLALAAAGVIFCLSLTVSERLYYNGWSNVKLGGRKKRSILLPKARMLPYMSARIDSRLLDRLVRRGTLALVWKDLRVIGRDLRNLSILLTPMLVGILYAAALILSGGPAAVEVPPGMPDWAGEALRTMATYGGLSVAMLVGWSLVSRLALTGLGQEGKSYWILKSASIRPQAVLKAKFVVACLPGVVLGWGLLAAYLLIQKTGVGVALYGLPVIALTTAATAGINLAFGVKGANLDWEDPRQMTRFSASCLSVIASSALLPVALVCFMVPPVAAVALGAAEIWGQLAGLVLGGALCLAAAVMPPRLALSHLEKLGED